MGYRRLDINLLPSELQPGPVVRYAVVINTIVIGVTVAFLIVDSFLGLTLIGTLKREIETKESLVQSLATIEADYNQLIAIEKHVNSIGRLIALASAEYTDMPVIMERITKLLPYGVYVDSVSSQQGNVGSISSEIRISLVASRSDPALLINTFSAFKKDEILGDCYMRSAEFAEGNLEHVLEAAGVTWSATGPDVADYSSADSFNFEIYSTIYTPIDPGDLAARVDKTEYFDVFTLWEADDEGQPGADEPGGRIAGAPEGVTAVEAY